MTRSITRHLEPTVSPDRNREPALERADWTILDRPELVDIAQATARTVARKYAAVIEYDDLYQEALILLATSPDTVASYRNEPGKLYRWLWCDLTNLAHRHANHRNRETSYETLRRTA